MLLTCCLLLLLFHLSCVAFWVFPVGFFPLGSNLELSISQGSLLLKSNKIKLRAEFRVSTSLNVSWHLALKAFCDNSYHLFSVLLCTRFYMGCFI